MQKLLLPCIGGLPKYDALSHPYRANSAIYLTDDSLKVDLITYKLFSTTKYDVLETFSIPAELIVAIEIITDKTVVEKQKSVIGRALIGQLVFGPVGAIVGGISGTGSKASSVLTVALCVAYKKAGSDELGSVAFAIDTPQGIIAAQGLVADYQRSFGRHTPGGETVL